MIRRTPNGKGLSLASLGPGAGIVRYPPPRYDSAPGPPSGASTNANTSSYGNRGNFAVTWPISGIGLAMCDAPVPIEPELAENV